MAEVHVLGNIKSAKGFPKQNLVCHWGFNFGNNWKLISGKAEGKTFCSSSEIDDDIYWNLPFDLHFATSGVVGWPKLYLQVFHIDWVKRSHLYGYGFLNVPTSPGSHVLDCYTWRPLGSLKERFVQFFIGGSLQLRNPDLIFSIDDRHKLNTESMGIVTVEINVVTRNFQKYGIEYY